MPRCRKWFRTAFRYLLTSVHRLQQSFFNMYRRHIVSSQGHSPTWNTSSANLFISLNCIPGYRKCVRLVFKHRFINFTTVVFWYFKKAFYEFSGPFAYLNHNFRDFVQVALRMPTTNKISSNDLSTHSNIASTSQISHFKTSRRPSMSFKAIHLIETSLPRLPRSRFFDTQEAENDLALFSTLWNITSSTSPKLHFKTIRR
jgi:hypothetical protein